MYDFSLITVPQGEDEIARHDWSHFPPNKSHKGKTSFSIIDKSAAIEGRLIARTAFIHGQIKGLVFAEQVTVEPSGCVDGEIFCRNLTILGSVRADIVCDSVTIRDGGTLSASLKYRSMKIEPGGQATGRFERRGTGDGSVAGLPIAANRSGQ